MTLDELHYKVIEDLFILGLPVDEVVIKLRPYSKTYYGRYFPDRQEIYLYPFLNKSGDFMSYDLIIKGGIHEMCHHIQHTNPVYRRNKGVMHDPQFWSLYNHYIDRALKLGVLSKEEVSFRCQEVLTC